jgi:hypothetical protein
MTICNGCLVVHRDGNIAYCSEELDGGLCAGQDLHHLGGVLACRVSPRWARCLHCDRVMQHRLSTAPVFVPEGLYEYSN